MHSFPFHEKVKDIWKATGFLEFIFEFFNKFDPTNYVPRINYTTYIIGLYLLDMIILLIFIDILYVSYSFSKKKFSLMWPLTILRSVTSYFVTVLFLPITETLISILQCTTNQNGELVLEYFENVLCWKVVSLGPSKIRSRYSSWLCQFLFP